MRPLVNITGVHIDIDHWCKLMLITVGKMTQIALHARCVGFDYSVEHSKNMRLYGPIQPREENESLCVNEQWRHYQSKQTFSVRLWSSEVPHVRDAFTTDNTVVLKNCDTVSRPYINNNKFYCLSFQLLKFLLFHK